MYKTADKYVRFNLRANEWLFTCLEHDDFQAIARSTQTFSVSIFSSPGEDGIGNC